MLNEDDKIRHIEIKYEFLIIYFENVAFYHAKLGSDVHPRVDNQTSTKNVYLEEVEHFTDG